VNHYSIYPSKVTALSVSAANYVETDFSNLLKCKRIVPKNKLYLWNDCPKEINNNNEFNFYVIFTWKNHDDFPLPCWALNTRTTNFCSSIKNARTILSRTALAHKTPPYGLDTVLFLLDKVFNLCGRTALIPLNGVPKSPHFGTVPFFLVYKYTSLPPGVFDTLRLLDLVLYESRRRSTNLLLAMMLEVQGGLWQSMSYPVSTLEL